MTLTVRRGDLANGGRGVGNVVESFLINPLARYLFHKEVFGDAVDNGKTFLSVSFDRATMSGTKFGFSDAVDVLNRFKYHMDFNAHTGFKSVENIE